MEKKIVILLVLVLAILSGCKNESSKIKKEPLPDKKEPMPKVSEKVEEQTFSGVKNLSEFKKTMFIPTLEHQIFDDKNSVYCATLLFAWDEIRKQLYAPLIIPSEFTDLNLLNKSSSYNNVLKLDEYKIYVSIDGENIVAKAEFDKSLPFELKLGYSIENFNFNGETVSAFGVFNYDIYEKIKESIQLVYYKNDENFIIKLLPKDKEHEIILFMSSNDFNSIADMVKEIEKLTIIGMIEMKDKKTNWRYSFNPEDVIAIPQFKFNIETEYETLQTATFKTYNKTFRFQKSYQRTAFSLDESGAAIESEAEIEVDSFFSGVEIEKPKPKKILFNKPFLVLLKRTDALNPYFGLWATNAELMIKKTIPKTEIWP
ncbi:MAG: hypothetical protein HC913_06885 [Microscillaceae bacterium]|nr:hypothetical protein [Microscillaceae bacterium]